MGCLENAESILMGRRLVKNAFRQGERETEEGRSEKMQRMQGKKTVAAGCKDYLPHRPRLWPQVLISSLSHTSRRELISDGWQTAMHMGRVIFPVLAPHPFDD